MNGTDWLVIAVAGAVVVAGLAVFVRFPRARRWIGAATSVVIGLGLAVIFVLAGALANIDIDGSLEPVPIVFGIACGLLGIAIAVVIVVRGR